MGSSMEKLLEFKNNMMKTFEMTDLGPLKYFVGLEVKQLVGSLFVSQKKYVEELLKKAGCFIVSSLLVLCILMRNYTPLTAQEMQINLGIVCSLEDCCTLLGHDQSHIYCGSDLSVYEITVYALFVCSKKDNALCG